MPSLYQIIYHVRIDSAASASEVNAFRNSLQARLTPFPGFAPTSEDALDPLAVIGDGGALLGGAANTQDTWLRVAVLKPDSDITDYLIRTPAIKAIYVIFKGTCVLHVCRNKDGDWETLYLVDNLPYRMLIPAARSRFQLLPAELRNRIYELALAQPEPVTLSRAYPFSRLFCAVREQRLARILSLTAVSKGIRGETRKMFYHVNTFVVDISRKSGRRWYDDQKLLGDWLLNLHGAGVKHLPSLTVDVRGWSDMDVGWRLGAKGWDPWEDCWSRNRDMVTKWTGKVGIDVGELFAKVRIAGPMGPTVVGQKIRGDGDVVSEAKELRAVYAQMF
jgi:hypothetical protein